MIPVEVKQFDKPSAAPEKITRGQAALYLINLRSYMDNCAAVTRDNINLYNYNATMQSFFQGKMTIYKEVAALLETYESKILYPDKEEIPNRKEI